MGLQYTHRITQLLISGVSGEILDGFDFEFYKLYFIQSRYSVIFWSGSEFLISLSLSLLSHYPLHFRNVNFNTHWPLYIIIISLCVQCVRMQYGIVWIEVYTVYTYILLCINGWGAYNNMCNNIMTVTIIERCHVHNDVRFFSVHSEKAYAVCVFNFWRKHIWTHIRHQAHIRLEKNGLGPV